MYACLGVICHLHFWQIDQGLLRATAVTRGWNGHRIRVSTQSKLWRRICSRYRHSNSQPFDHDSGAPTNKLSRLPCGRTHRKQFEKTGLAVSRVRHQLRLIVCRCCPDLQEWSSADHKAKFGACDLSFVSQMTRESYSKHKGGDVAQLVEHRTGTLRT